MRYQHNLNIGPVDGPKEVVNSLSVVKSLNNGESNYILP